MNIRQANLTDLPVIHDLIRESFLAMADHYGEESRDKLAQSAEKSINDDLIQEKFHQKYGDDFFVAVSEDDNVIGCIAMIRKSEEDADLVRMAVNPTIRSKGIGGNLLQHLIKHAKDCGVLSLKLITANPSAARFYSKHNFETYNQSTSNYGTMGFQIFKMIYFIQDSCIQIKYDKLSFEDKTYDKNHYIKQKDAIFRESIVENVKYEVQLALPKGEHYFGRVIVKFDVKLIPNKSLSLDFRGVKIQALEVNGALIQNQVRKIQTVFINHSINLSPETLKLGENIVRMNIFNKYRKDGVGLHSFTDQVDLEQYLYTQFEADFCHYVFPCFDQPDIKAILKFSAAVPSDWTVIANEYEDPDQTNQDSYLNLLNQFKQLANSLGSEDVWYSIKEPKVFIFSETAKISTYIYAIVAGPYGFYESNKEGLPPMRIYARKSLVESINHEEMFLVTQSGMNFYKNLFGKPYPFNKYDQVFVPEHNYGAMENVGCVTFNEIYLYRGENPSLAKRLRFSITNLHELAHMWFGNLVTMKWWNDLWLNESFATYMSFLAMSEPEELKFYHTVWATFLRYKFWGIETDQLSSTHPICCEISSTDEAESLFDGISYGKGSSWLKQVYNILGYDTIQKGLHRYFEKHQWKNTTLPDFVECLQWAHDNSGDKSMGKDFNFTEWCETWLTTSGVNVIEPIIEYNQDDSIKKLTIKQTCDLRGNNRLRKQKLNIAIYDQNLNENVIKDIVISDKEELNEIDISQYSQIPAKAIILNHGDHAYTKVRYDQKSLECFQNELSKFSDYLTRGVVWRQLWVMVQDRKVSSLKFFNIVINQLPFETVEQSISSTLATLSSLITYYVPIQKVRECKEKIFDVLFNCLLKELEPSVKNAIADEIFSFIQTQKQIKLVLYWKEKGYIYAPKDFIDGSNEESLCTLNRSHVLLILKNLFKLSSLTTDEKMKLLEEVLIDDKSDIATRTRMTCMASIPDAKQKEQVWNELTDPKSQFSLYEKQAKMSGFYSFDQLDLCAPYFEKFYEVLANDFEQKHTYKYIEQFFYTMLPRMDIKDSHIVKLVQIKNQIPDTNNMYSNVLQDGIELLIRSKQIREMALI